SEVLSLDDDEGLVGPSILFGAISSDDSCDGGNSPTSGNCALMALQLRASLDLVEVQAHSSEARARREDADHEHSGPSICFPSYETLPDAWRPSKELEAQLRLLPSPPDGQGLDRAAEAAARGAYGELVSLIRRPGNVKKLGHDALDAMLIGASAGGNMPDIQRTSLLYSRDILIELSGDILDNASAKHGKCDSLFGSDLSILVGYGHYLRLQLPQNSSLDATQAALEKLANLAVSDCGRLDRFLNFTPDERLNKYPSDPTDSDQIDVLFGMALQATNIMFMLANPNVKLPANTLDYVAKLWAYFFDYPFPDVASYAEGIMDNAFVQNSYLVTHIPYMLTGFQRFALKVDDAPWLFQYLRLNFYSTIAQSVKNHHFDLAAEFVDLFRQYGCTEENDIQLRDGTRYLLSVYREAGSHWLDIKQTDGYEHTDADTYAQSHLPWTAFIALRRRLFEEPTEGSFGAIDRKMVALALKRTGDHES
ncbi:unnamed protein product, partial [Polarella glacialis]